MRLSGWHVDSFGALRDVGVRGLPPGLVVIHGPNAAGKSTLLAFIQRTLFGYPHRNRQDVNHYEPASGDPRRGGRLFLDVDGGTGASDDEVIVERHDGTGLKVIHADGTTGAEADLSVLTGGCDDQLFNAVFAFDLADLRSIETLTDDAVRDRLFSAGVRGAGRSARAVQDRLEQEARELWTPRSRTAAIDRVQGELRELEEQLEQARHLAASYPERLAEESRRADAVARLDEQLAEAEARERRAESLLAAWPVWRRREETAAELEAAGPPPEVPEGALERHEHLRAWLDGLTERLDRLGRERRRVEADLDADLVDDRLRDVADDVLALEQERTAQRERIERLTTCEADLERLAAERARALEALGDWDPDQLDRVNVSVEDRGELRTFRDRIDRARQRVTEAEAAVSRLATSTEVLRNQQSSTGAAPTDLDDEELLSAERIERDRQRLAEVRAAISEADAASSALEAVARFKEHQSAQRPGWLVPMLAGLIGLMAVSGALAALADATLLMVVLWLGAVLLLVVTVVIRRTDAGETDDPAVAAHQKAWLTSSELAERAEALGLPSNPSFADTEQLAVALDRAERRREELDRRGEQARRAETELAEAEDELERAEEARDEARREEEETQREWRAWCRERGLDPETDPATTAELVDVLERIREHRERVAAVEAEMAPLRASILDFASRTAAALQAVGRDPVLVPDADADPDEAALTEQQHRLRRQVEQLRRLTVAVNADAERRAEQERLRERLETLEGEVEAEQERQKRLRTEREELLATAGVKDEDQLREAMNRARAHEELRARLRQADNDLLERFGTDAEADRRRAELATGDREAWTAARDDARRHRDDLRRERDAALEALVEARRARTEVETSERIIQLDQQRQLVLTRRDELVHDWRVATLARRLVAHTLEGFEQQRQPGVLRRAGAHFSQVTGGAHPSIRQRGEELLVLDDRHRAWGVNTLSRGTAEQLYLCLRLALAEDLANRQQRLPFVMDDVLVNFDPDRAREVANLFVSVAATSQLLYFTCHPTTVDLLREAGAAAVYDLPRGGSTPVRRAS